MSIPTSITAAITSIQAQVIAAQPLANATSATRTALKLNAANLVADIESTLTETSLLDTWTAPVDAPSIIAGVLSVVIAADDQQTLSLMRGICGRASINLDQLP